MIAREEDIQPDGAKEERDRRREKRENNKKKTSFLPIKISFIDGRNDIHYAFNGFLKRLFSIHPFLLLKKTPNFCEILLSPTGKKF